MAASAPPAPPAAPLGTASYPPPAPTTIPTTQSSSATKKWVIGGAIAAGVIVAGSVGGAIGAGRNGAAPAPTVTITAEAAAPVETPEAAPAREETPEAAASEESTPAADPVAFIAQSNSHLDDMLKDLGDIEVTVAEEGFWRLLSNYAELSFNLGQLQGLDVPASVANDWTASLTTLEDRIDDLSDAIATEDGPTILGSVDDLRAQVEATREVANSAR